MKNLSPEKFILLKQNLSAKAIVSSSITYTFEEFRKKVLNRASALKSQNVSGKDRVGVLGQNSVDYVTNILALWQLSAIPVPINSKLNKSEINDLLIAANCNSILVSEKFLDNVSGIDIKVIDFRSDDNYPITESREQLKLSDPAVIIFTSGSTGKSKGIILSFNSLYYSAINSNQLLRYTRSDRWLASLPFYHIGGFSIITRSLLFGIPLIIPDSLSTEDLVHSMHKYQPTFISLVAAQLKKIVDDKTPANPELKNCLVGGGFSDLELIRNAYDLGWPLNIVYGSTETSSFVTALLKDEFIFKPNSVGRAVPTNIIKITDDDGSELKPFEIGEVAVQSNALMQSYLDFEETKQIVRNGYYHTGDIGYMDDEGYLFVEGRKNYVISTGGENINPIEVEKALLEHPLILEAAVFPLKDQKWGEMISAAVVLKDNSAKISFDDLKIFLKERISGYKIPKKIFFEDKLPKTELGKIEKDKLVKRYRLTSL